MTMYLGKTVQWKLYPDLILPHEAAVDIILPPEVFRAREREAFIQSQKRNYQLDTRSNNIAREAISGMLALTMGERSAREHLSTPKNKG